MNKTGIYIVLALLLVFPTLVGAMPDPSGPYCFDHGGTVEEGARGVILCEFKDGTECEVWSFVRKECAPGQFPKGTWVDSQPKDPDFTIQSSVAGWVKDKGSTDFVDEKDANYFYYHDAVVTNINQFSTVSPPVKLVVYSDPVQTITIPPLRYGEYSPGFDVYIPLAKEQHVEMAVNPDRSVIESDYDNDFVYKYEIPPRPSEVVDYLYWAIPFAFFCVVVFVAYATARLTKSGIKGFLIVLAIFALLVSGFLYFEGQASVRQPGLITLRL